MHLSEFRTRLLVGGAERRLLDLLLQCARDRGLLKVRGRQRTDSTHALAAVRALNRVELVAETIGRDGLAILVAVDADEAPSWLRDLPALGVLRSVWIQNYLVTETGVRWRTDKDGLPPAVRFISSPYDPDAHYARNHATSWVGYKVHLTETCEDDTLNLITNVTTTAGPVADGAPTPRSSAATPWSRSAVSNLIARARLSPSPPSRPRGGRRRRVIGINASAKPKETRDWVARNARGTASLKRDLTDDEIVLDERYHGGTYGIPDEATLDAMRLAARTEGMIADPVYEGQSMLLNTHRERWYDREQPSDARVAWVRAPATSGNVEVVRKRSRRWSRRVMPFDDEAEGSTCVHDLGPSRDERC